MVIIYIHVHSITLRSVQLSQ